MSLMNEVIYPQMAQMAQMNEESSIVISSCRSRPIGAAGSQDPRCRVSAPSAPSADKPFPLR
jgi:hypothetical protein